MKTLYKRKVDRRLETYDFTKKVVRWIVLSLKGETPIPLLLLEDLCDRLSKILKTRGIAFTLKYVKATRNNFYNYLSSNPFRIPDSPCYGESKFPRILGPLKKYVDNEHKDVLRLVLTILTATRSIKLKGEVCTDSITQPVKGDVPDLTQHMPDFWRVMGYKYNKKDLPRKLASFDMMTYRLSRGPNGHALLASNYEAQLLPESLVTSLNVIARGIKSYIEGVVSNGLLQFQSTWTLPPQKMTGMIRKTSTFPDKEGKQRTIGILDYWSQLALKPLHRYIGKFLEKIPQDCTLDQSKFMKLVLGSPKYYSVDLSSATDRFPIELIKQLLKIRLPATYVDAWADVMVGYPFDFHQNKLVYSAGTPMGAYTSFNSFALTHHFIIFHCCKEVGVSWKTLPYALLGDDIVIGNEEVALMYMEVIKSLHVEYSPAKTHQSKDFFEFAKRVFYKETEISPFPISALRAADKSSDTLVLTLMEVIKRGFAFGSIESSVTLYFSVVKEFRSKICKKIGLNAYYFHRVLECTQGIVPAWEVFNDILGKNNLPCNHFKKWHKTKFVLDISYMKLLENNIVAALKEIKNYQLSSVMKSNDLLKSFYSWCDEQKEIKSEIKPMAHAVTFSPFYGAIYALEKELKMERKSVLDSINNHTLDVNKKISKSKVNKNKVSDLLSVSHDKKEIINTTRKFFVIIEKMIIDEYWRTYDPLGFNAADQAAVTAKWIKDLVDGK